MCVKVMTCGRYLTLSKLDRKYNLQYGLECFIMKLLGFDAPFPFVHVQYSLAIIINFSCKYVLFGTYYLCNSTIH
jgi:hypothetical protein